MKIIKMYRKCMSCFIKFLYRNSVILMTSFFAIVLILYVYSTNEVESVRSFLFFIVSVYIAVIIAFLEHRSNTRARIEPMLLVEHLHDNEGRLAYTVYYLRVKNVGVNTGTEICIDASFRDELQLLSIYWEKDLCRGKELLEEFKEITKDKRCISGGEYLDFAIFAYNPNKDNPSIDKVNEVILHLSISYIDERSNRKFTDLKELNFSRYIGRKFYLSSNVSTKKEILKVLKTKLSYDELIEKSKSIE